MTATAKLFMNGRSQAVRLPKEFRFDTKDVRIYRDGSRVILEPGARDETDGEWIERLGGMFDEDFARAVLDDRPGPDALPEGPNFDVVD